VSCASFSDRDRMAETRVVLDTCAVIQLRKSACIDSMEKSLFQLAGGSQNLKAQRMGEKLRGWLDKAIGESGWTVCITKGAIMESEGKLKDAIYRLAGQAQGRPAAVKLILDNRPYTNLLYERSLDCSGVSEERMAEIKEEISSAYHKWENDTTRNCVTKYGIRDKPYTPEPQDINRLAEAVANKNGSSRTVIFLSSDSHFLCHVSTINKEFGIEVKDFRKL